jgi:hypothetical protein
MLLRACGQRFSFCDSLHACLFYVVWAPRVVRLLLQYCCLLPTSDQKVFSLSSWHVVGPVASWMLGKQLSTQRQNQLVAAVVSILLVN